MREPAKHKIATVQVNPRIGEKSNNIEKVFKYLREAKDLGAELIAFPELCNTGYKFASRSEAFDLSEEIPDGPTTKKLVDFSSKEGVYIIMGIDERVNDRLYNSAVFVGPEGFIDVYRKKHLFSEEKLWFEPGDRRLLLHDTSIGKIGVTICYEIGFPEMARIYALKEADVLINPAAYVRDINRIFIQARAAENKIFVVSAARIGEERGLQYARGLTMIVSPNGEILTHASPDKEEICIAEIDSADANRAKRLNEFNHIFTDRRTDIYDEYL